MKTIIDGKRYDTDTMTKVAMYKNAYGESDFHWCRETLYRSPGGRWVLYGEGGALTPWSRACGDSRCRGDGWRILTDAESLEWLESHDEVEAIEEHFGDQIENG